MAARLLGFAPNELMLVAAHPSDLRGAQACGLRTAYVHRRAGVRPRGAAAAGAAVTGFDLICQRLPATWHANGCSAHERDAPPARCCCCAPSRPAASRAGPTKTAPGPPQRAAGGGRRSAGGARSSRRVRRPGCAGCEPLDPLLPRWRALRPWHSRMAAGWPACWAWRSACWSTASAAASASTCWPRRCGR